mmetsp:Transcript_27842/g.42108  ORF Transcript_27842/g.42108 Transcript_27842/m.42108 type:complete len:88 (+) Transcript_27842:1874-2137(+)
MSGSSSRIADFRKDSAFDNFTSCIPEAEDTKEEEAEFPIIKEVEVHEECSPVNRKHGSPSHPIGSSPHFPYLPLKEKGQFNFQQDDV